MVNTLTLRVEDRGLDLRSGLIKGYTIGICYFSAKQATFGVRVKTGMLGIRIMCLSRVICLSADCCLSEITKNPTKQVGLI